MHSLGRSITLLLLAMPLPAVAAPFCVYSEALPPQCIYFDAASCAKRATQLGAYCSVNSDEVHASATIGHYCLLTSSLVSSCVYVDRGNCYRDAAQQHGVCVEFDDRAGKPGGRSLSRHPATNGRLLARARPERSRVPELHCSPLRLSGTVQTQSVFRPRIASGLPSFTMGISPPSVSSWRA